jgi:hypothetical protein
MRDSQPLIESMEVGTLAQAIVDTVREPLLVLDKDLQRTRCEPLILRDVQGCPERHARPVVL